MSEPNCPCDVHIFPVLPLTIPPGLDSLPRQLGGFSEFRAALLAQIQHGPKDHPALARWRARDPDDFLCGLGSRAKSTLVSGWLAPRCRESLCSRCGLRPDTLF